MSNFEINCGRCNKNYNIVFGEKKECPECGFGPEDCDHPPREHRSNGIIYDHGEDEQVENLYCGICGTNL